MSGAAPDATCRKRLRSHDSKIQSDDKEEGKKMSGGGSEVKNRKTSIAALFETGKQKEGRTSSNKNVMADDREKEERIIWNGHNKVKSMKKVSPASLEKMKKQQKLCNANKKKMQIDVDEEGKHRHNGDHKLANRKESPTLYEKKNKEKMNKTHKEKMGAAYRKERKILSHHNRVKSREVSTAFFGKEKKGKRLNKANNEKLQNDEDEENAPFTPAVKEKRMRPSESTEAMLCHDKPDMRSVPSIVSKEKKIDTSSGSKYKKRKMDHTLLQKGKRSDNKIHSDRVQEKKICGGDKEKNKHTPFAFLKFIYNRFEEFLLIPPAVAHKLADLTNQHVYLEDSEENRSKVRLSVVNDSLAFHQGWNIFVSDHSIKWGEFLLFDYIARNTFSVRVFGLNSHERLSFKKDPKRAGHGVGSGPAPQDNNNENDACIRSHRKTLIMISESGASAHNEDVMNLTTSDADSTHHVTINTNKDLERVESGVGNLPDGECGTNYISAACSERKTSSEIVNDAAPLIRENDGRVGHELQVHDLDEDLIRKQGISCIPLGSIVTVEKHQIHNNMNISQNSCRKYAAPGGFRCLEKWWRAGLNIRAALDGIVLIELENTKETDSKLVDGYGSIGLNTMDEYFCSEGNHTHNPPVFTMTVKEPLGADRVSKCRLGETEIDHSVNEKCGGAAVQIETQGEQLEPVGSIVNSQRNNIPLSVNAVVPDKYSAIGLNPVGPEVTRSFVEPMLTVPIEKASTPVEISKNGSSKTQIDHDVNEKGTIVQLETKMDQVEPVGSSVCSQSSNKAMSGNRVAAHVSEHCFSKQEYRKFINCVVPESLLPMKDKIMESDDHSLLKFNLQLCVPDTTRKWLELSKSLPNAIKQKRHDRNVILLKDPMKRLWPVLYHENPVFVGFTAGWRHFVAANNLQSGDLCDLIKEPDDDEPVYSVLMTRQ